MSYNLQQIITSPTYPTESPKTILDLVFVNNINLISNLEVLPNISHTCDHKAIGFTLNISKNKTEFKKIEKHLFNENSLKLLNNELFSIDWFQLTENLTDINKIYETIYLKYSEVFDKYIKKITTFIKHKKVYNREINHLINKRRQLSKYKSNTFQFNTKYRYLSDLIGFKLEIHENNKMQTLIEKSKIFIHFINTSKIRLKLLTFCHLLTKTIQNTLNLKKFPKNLNKYLKQSLFKIHIILTLI